MNGYPFKPSEWTKEGLPIIRIQNLSDPEKPFNHFSGEVPSRYIVETGDVLISWSASLDAFLWTRGRAWLNQHIFKGIPHLNSTQKEFFYYLMKHAIERIAKNARGSTMHHVTLKEFVQSEVAMPPLEEQRQIAEVLSVVQRAIDRQERLIVLTEALKKVLMHRLFTQGTRRESLKQTETGLMPDSWRQLRCEDLCTTISVGVVVKPRSYYVDSGVPAFRSFNVREDRLIADDLVFFSDADNNGVLAKSKLRTGDVLIVRTGYPGTSCVVPPQFEGANCIDIIFARPGPRVESAYLSRFFNSAVGKNQVTASSHGLAQQHFNVGAVKRLLVSLPDLNEQREIVRLLAAVDAKVDVHLRLASTMSALFRTLLHQLLTAEIRVHDLDLSVLGAAERAMRVA